MSIESPHNPSPTRMHDQLVFDAFDESGELIIPADIGVQDDINEVAFDEGSQHPDELDEDAEYKLRFDELRALGSTSYQAAMLIPAELLVERFSNLQDAVMSAHQSGDMRAKKEALRELEGFMERNPKLLSLSERVQIRK